MTATAVAPANEQVRLLTKALARGDEDAFEKFHASYFDRLLRYLFVVTRGDEEAARDASQETFVRVARHVREFESEEAFWSWLTVVARSAAADGSRKRSRYWRLMQRFTFFRTSVDPIHNSEPEPLESFLADSLSDLPDDDRALIEAKYFRRTTVRALAEEFQLSEKAIEARLARARKQLRDKLSKRLRDETRA